MDHIKKVSSWANSTFWNGATLVKKPSCIFMYGSVLTSGFLNYNRRYTHSSDESFELTVSSISLIFIGNLLHSKFNSFGTLIITIPCMLSICDNFFVVRNFCNSFNKTKYV